MRKITHWFALRHIWVKFTVWGMPVFLLIFAWIAQLASIADVIFHLFLINSLHLEQYIEEEKKELQRLKRHY